MRDLWERTEYCICLSMIPIFHLCITSQSPMRWHNDGRGKKHPSAIRHSQITRGLNITDVLSRRTLQHAVAPHLGKQAARYTRRITRSCTSGQNGAAAISIMAFHLRFPVAAELSSQLQGNAYQSSRISIKALNPAALFLATFSTSSFPKVLKPLIAWRNRKIMMLCWRMRSRFFAHSRSFWILVHWKFDWTFCTTEFILFLHRIRWGTARGNNKIYRLIRSSVVTQRLTCE